MWLPSIAVSSRTLSASVVAAHDIVLRDYQQAALDNVVQAVEDGIKRPAVVLATGGGKTVVMSSLIPKLRLNDSSRTKVLVLAHKEELVRQAHFTISKMNPDLKVQMDMQKSVPTSDADVIVGSVMTLVRLTRLHRYNPLEFRAIILDECHHAMAASWEKILNYFGALDAASEILVIGFTATMERADGKPLGNVFESIVFERSLRMMVEKKELCDIKFYTIKVDVDLGRVRLSMGDFNTLLLAQVMNVREVNLRVALSYIQLRKEKRFKSTLIFCVDIEHCKTLCGVLQANGVNAQYVTGETVKYERQAILEDFKNGKIDVLCNVLVFTEGTDIPNIDSLVLARPTKSRPLLVQMLGRGLRLHQGKDYCHVIDVASTVGIGVLSVPTLLGYEGDIKIDDKSLLELEKEVEEAKEKGQKSNSTSVNDILKIQEKIKDLKLDFNTIDGFAELENHNEAGTQSIRDINKEFKRSRFNWLRLDYNVWGVQIPFSNKLYTIERCSSEGDKPVEFELYAKSFIPYGVIIATQFKSKKISSRKITTGTLQHALAIASSNIGMILYSTSERQKVISDKQKNMILKRFVEKVTREFGDLAFERFKNELSKMTAERASNFIFASKYSVNCLYVKWEITKLTRQKKEN